MKPIVKFLNLNPSEHGLLIGALFRLIVIRIGLWVLPLESLLRHIQNSQVSKTCEVSWKPERLAWAIRAVSRYLPGTGNCLVQSLAAQTMLARRGYASHLRIGVAKDEGGNFMAHAWVECEGKIVIGGTGASQYTAFPPLEFQRR